MKQNAEYRNSERTKHEFQTILTIEDIKYS